MASPLVIPQEKAVLVPVEHGRGFFRNLLRRESCGLLFHFRGVFGSGRLELGMHFRITARRREQVFGESNANCEYGSCYHLVCSFLVLPRSGVLRLVSLSGTVF